VDKEMILNYTLTPAGVAYPHPAHSGDPLDWLTLLPIYPSRSPSPRIA